jgi:hypothetical protein
MRRIALQNAPRLLQTRDNTAAAMPAADPAPKPLTVDCRSASGTDSPVLVQGRRRAFVPYRCPVSHLRGETPTFCVKSLDIAEGFA